MSSSHSRKDNNNGVPQNQNPVLHELIDALNFLHKKNKNHTIKKNEELIDSIGEYRSSSSSSNNSSSGKNSGKESIISNTTTTTSTTTTTTNAEEEEEENKSINDFCENDYYNIMKKTGKKRKQVSDCHQESLSSLSSSSSSSPQSLRNIEEIQNLVYNLYNRLYFLEKEIMNKSSIIEEHNKKISKMYEYMEKQYQYEFLFNWYNNWTCQRRTCDGRCGNIHEVLTEQDLCEELLHIKNNRIGVIGSKVVWDILQNRSYKRRIHNEIVSCILKYLRAL